MSDKPQAYILGQARFELMAAHTQGFIWKHDGDFVAASEDELIAMGALPLPPAESEPEKQHECDYKNCECVLTPDGQFCITKKLHHCNHPFGLHCDACENRRLREMGMKDYQPQPQAEEIELPEFTGGLTENMWTWIINMTNTVNRLSKRGEN